MWSFRLVVLLLAAGAALLWSSLRLAKVRVGGAAPLVIEVHATGIAKLASPLTALLRPPAALALRIA